jgi:cytochrome P450
MGRERELIENLRVLNGFAYDVIARRRRQLQQQQQQLQPPAQHAAAAASAPAPGQEPAQQQHSSQPAVAAETKNRHGPPAVEAKQSAAQPDEVSPRRQAHAPRRDDLLSLFLSAAANRGEEISDRELRDVVVNFLIAGQSDTWPGLVPCA